MIGWEVRTRPGTQDRWTSTRTFGRSSTRVLALACGEVALAERLTNAYAGALTRLGPPTVVPDVFRERLVPLLAMADLRQDPERGSIAASMESLSELERSRLARDIVDAFDWVCHQRGPTRS